MTVPELLSFNFHLKTLTPCVSNYLILIGFIGGALSSLRPLCLQISIIRSFIKEHEHLYEILKEQCHEDFAVLGPFCA